MSTSDDRRLVRPSRVQEGDTWMTVDEVGRLLKFTKNQIYKYNQQGLPVHYLGKHCRYLYSEVMNWAMSKHMAVIDNPELFEPLPLPKLPKCWPSEVWPEIPSGPTMEQE